MYVHVHVYMYSYCCFSWRICQTTGQGNPAAAGLPSKRSAWPTVFSVLRAAVVAFALVPFAVVAFALVAFEGRCRGFWLWASSTPARGVLPSVPPKRTEETPLANLGPQACSFEQAAQGCEPALSSPLEPATRGGRQIQPEP